MNITLLMTQILKIYLRKRNPLIFILKPVPFTPVSISVEAIAVYTSYSRRVVGPPLSSHHVVISHSANQTQESTQSVHLWDKTFVRVYLHPLPSSAPPQPALYLYVTHASYLLSCIIFHLPHLLESRTTTYRVREQRKSCSQNLEYSINGL